MAARLAGVRQTSLGPVVTLEYALVPEGLQTDDVSSVSLSQALRDLTALAGLSGDLQVVALSLAPASASDRRHLGTLAACPVTATAELAREGAAALELTAAVEGLTLLLAEQTDRRKDERLAAASPAGLVGEAAAAAQRNARRNAQGHRGGL
jgi:Flp pilus assembly protein CpaB